VIGSGYILCLQLLLHGPGETVKADEEQGRENEAVGREEDVLVNSDRKSHKRSNALGIAQPLATGTPAPHPFHNFANVSMFAA